MRYEATIDRPEVCAIYVFPWKLRGELPASQFITLIEGSSFGIDIK